MLNPLKDGLERASRVMATSRGSPARGVMILVLLPASTVCACSSKKGLLSLAAPDSILVYQREQREDDGEGNSNVDIRLEDSGGFFRDPMC